MYLCSLKPNVYTTCGLANGYKTSEIRPGLDFCQKKFVCAPVHSGCFSIGGHLNLLLVIAGHLECAHGEEEKKVPEQPKKGGEPALLILHPSLGNNGLKPS